MTVNEVKAFYRRCKKRFAGSVGVLDAERICGQIVDRKLARVVKKRAPRRRSRCAHCGMIGKRTGHMECQYPQD